ncbi:MAG: hypothetical protein FGM58_00230 [Acidimicrobiia bacterium]|nr:hypothetical protein [Acidimicrobiia bacterium]
MVTLVCLPLLALDVVSGQTRSGAAEVGAWDPGLVVATDSTLPDTYDPMTVEMDWPTPEELAQATTTTAPPTTTTAPRPTTTTTTRRVTVTTPPPPSVESVMACLRMWESRNNYGAVDRTGTFMGAYQIYQGGWDNIAASIGRADLVGVPPNLASPADQDAVALEMYRRYGLRPWNGACA